MNGNLVKFTMRINAEAAQKLEHVAKYYGRSKNGQMVWLAKQCIAEFEKEHGKIELEDA